MKNYNIDLKFFKNDPTYYFEKERFGKSFFYNVSYKGYEAKVYVFELYKILSNESFPLFGKKETLNGLSLIPIYIEDFKKGKEFFKSKYTVSTEILFQNINEYVKTLQTCYCHKEQGQGKRGWCWYSWNYPIIFNDEKIKEYGYFAGIISEIDELKEHYHQFKVIGQCDHSLIPQQTETKWDRLKVKQIAIIHVYEGLQITRENAGEIAAKHGYTAKNSGEGLFQDYTYFCSTANRKGIPTEYSSKKLKNKIELFESVVNHLSDNNKQRAIDEIKILKTLLENEYQ